MAWKRLAVAHSCLPSPPHCASQKKSILKTLLILHHEFAKNGCTKTIFVFDWTDLHFMENRGKVKGIVYTPEERLKELYTRGKVKGTVHQRKG